MLGDHVTALDESPEVQSQPSKEEVRAQLERLVGSSGFLASPRDCKFLSYVVEETLAGRAGRIKAYSIGTEVFERDPTFDAQNDPVVRIEAGRLRRAIEHYYLTAGQDDPVLIDIPKGRYVPTFTRRAQSKPSEALQTIAPSEAEPHRSPRTFWGALAAAIVVAALAGSTYWALDRNGAESSPRAAATLPFGGPTLLVMPFANLGEIPEAKIFAEGLTEEVLSQLARFRELTVLGRETSKSIPPSTDVGRLQRELGVAYVLEGSIRASTDRMRVTGRLLDARTGGVLWSQTYDDDLRVRDFLAVQDDVAQKVATAVAQPYGIIFHADERRSSQQTPDDLEAYACTLQFYAYRAVLTPAGHATVRTCLERAVARHPSYATAWAMLSLLYTDEDRVRFNPRQSPAAMERALEAAQRAVRHDPRDVRALQALMSALYFNQQPAEGQRIGEQALALNPNDTELLAEFGLRVAQAGEWQRGAALLEQALARNPGHSGFYNASLAWCAYMQRDNPRALTLLRQAKFESYPLFNFVAALVYSEAEMKAEAEAARARFLVELPNFFNDIDAQMDKRNFRHDDRARIIAGARKAGFPVPP